MFNQLKLANIKIVEKCFGLQANVLYTYCYQYVSMQQGMSHWFLLLCINAGQCKQTAL